MKKIWLIIPCVLLLVGVLFFAPRFFAAKQNPAQIRATPSETLSERNLRISVVNYKAKGEEPISIESGNYRSISLWDLADVTIDIDGKNTALADALQSSQISGDELVAYARLDAAQGICGEAVTTKNGLTEFTYHYPEFSLHCVYDVYETPDGKNHLIKDLSLYGRQNTPVYNYTWDENGEPVDYEDWGLTFETSDITASGMHLHCTQSGGQQLGRLELVLALLDKQDSQDGQIEPILENGEAALSTEITMNGTTDIPISFEEIYGTLSPGDYTLTLQIADRYSKDALSPMIRKFHDTQWYTVEFTVSK